MPYNYDELYKINGGYICEHHLNQADLDKVNNLCLRIEESRQGDPIPMDGDKIICISPTKGEVSRNGYLEKRGKELAVCVYPGVPFIFESLYTDADGESWFPFREEQFLEQAEFVGKTPRFFKVWGHLGQCGNGAVYFQAEVFLWKVTDPRFY